MICELCKSEISKPETLTDRQKTILDLMSQGMTNEQISRRIKFSHSTVRMESMAIYRFFGVNNRHDAVKAARLSGYLQSDREYANQLPFWTVE